MTIGDTVKRLKEAIDHAKQGHADVGTKHTEKAMTHMRQIKKPVTVSGG
jgi:hypothetical protein